MRPLDLVGKRFENLEVVCREENTPRGMTRWLCQCDCGNTVIVTRGNLQTGNTKSCGCLKWNDLHGLRFGMLTALSRDGLNSHGSYAWLCECDCGALIIAPAPSLKSGATVSCGCYRRNRAQLEGERFGRLVAISIQEIKDNRVFWLCQCDCGQRSIVPTTHLTSGHTRSCGCWKRDRAPEHARKHLRLFGPAHPRWNADLTAAERDNRREGHLEWSAAILQRGNFTCDLCNARGGALHAHHLDCWAAFPERRFDLSNGLPLCTSCHYNFHAYMGGLGQPCTAADYTDFKALVLTYAQKLT